MMQNCDPARVPDGEPPLLTSKDDRGADTCPTTTPLRRTVFMRLRDRLTLTPAQADTLACIKFPCC